MGGGIANNMYNNDDGKGGRLSDDVFYLFLQKQKIGAELHIYLQEGTYHKRLLEGLTLMI